MTITVVHPVDPGTPTGLHALTRQVVEALLAGGERVRLVLAKPDAPGGLADAAAVESYDGLGAGLELRWLPAESFAPEARHRLGFALEPLARDSRRLLCVGVGASAFVGSLAARQAGVPCTALVVARDVLGRLLQHPDEIAATLARSDLLVCTNPAVVELLAAFFAPELARLAAAERLAIARPSDAAGGAAPVARADHVCTTGGLGLFDDLGELAARVLDELRATGAERWLHVGTIDARSVGRLTSVLALRGLAAAFEATGWCRATDYARHVRGAHVLLKPRGEADTGLSLLEAHRWGVRVSLPAGASFTPDGGLLPAAGAPAPPLLDPAALARRLCA